MVTNVLKFLWNHQELPWTVVAVGLYWTGDYTASLGFLIAAVISLVFYRIRMEQQASNPLQQFLNLMNNPQVDVQIKEVTVETPPAPTRFSPEN